MSDRLIARVGEALYGERWQTPLPAISTSRTGPFAVGPPARTSRGPAFTSTACA